MRKPRICNVFEIKECIDKIALEKGLYKTFFEIELNIEKYGFNDWLKEGFDELVKKNYNEILFHIENEKKRQDC